MTAHPRELPLLPATPVKSSNIRALAYSEATKHLQVTFHSGDTYDYLDVPPAAYRAFNEAKSKGKFLSEAIRPRFRSFKRA